MPLLQFETLTSFFVILSKAVISPIVNALEEPKPVFAGISEKVLIKVEI